MKIVGGPEELATFVRCVGGEKTEWLDAAPAVTFAAPTAVAPSVAPKGDGFSSWIVIVVAFMIMWLITKA